ncbi:MULTISPECIES: Zn-ribbon domain-containing OB-fold protein [Mycobacterium]|uniref:DNA-binding protein n=1 Tax=Mycobacterium paraseoulense TaxID=590652 RepID=A0A1X0IC84_9MYCO|nr:OB-fold domain-containing protein [Mycobacterium paraseoulense]MCV7397941.1 OB-fold domain-containing protein [Mycobacterium paraseoulense]ORB41096.1 DNA-binding protein [Mycobacterium paraseoulense]
MDSVYHRPDFRLAPNPSVESHAFWTGGECGQLMISRCGACGRFFHPPGPACWRCRSTDVGPQPVSGRATVAAYTVNRQPWIPGLDPPYIVAMVELEDEPDVRLITNVVDVTPADIHVGLQVEVFFEDWIDVTGEENSRVWLPLFRPRSS